MEILSNFSSIYCFIAFVIGAVFMLAMLSIAAMGKVKEPRNKVRFYVTKWGNEPVLWFGKPIWEEKKLSWEAPSRRVHPMPNWLYFHDYNLNPNDFVDMKEDEIREVFINMED